MAKKTATTWLVTQLAQHVGLERISPLFVFLFQFKILNSISRQHLLPAKLIVFLLPECHVRAVMLAPQFNKLKVHIAG